MPPPALVLEHIDQTSDMLVVHNAIPGATLSISVNGAPLVQAEDWRVLGNWAATENTLGRTGSPYKFGNVADGRPLFTGDFSGSGSTDFLFCTGGNGQWWIGRFNQTKLTWVLAGNSYPTLGNTTGGQPPIWSGTGKFSGSGKLEILVYVPITATNPDGRWWLGQFTATDIAWSQAGDTLGVYGSSINFGNILDLNHRIWTGDFSGSGKTEVLFFSGDLSDGNWWLGQFTGTNLSWTKAGNTLGKAGSPINFGNLLDGRPIKTGDFSGAGKMEILFYSPALNDGNWWLGQINGTALSWSNPGNTLGNFGSPINFGNVNDGRPIWINRFSGAANDEVLFYSPALTDGNWWLGEITGGKFSWSNVGNTLGNFGSTVNFGNIDDGRPIWSGNFTGSGRADILFYFPGDQNWWLGVLKSGKYSWKLVGNSRRFTQAWAKRASWVSNFQGTGLDNLVFFSDDSGDWNISSFGRAQIPLPHLLLPGDKVSAVQTLNGVSSAPSAAVTVDLACTTQHFDRGRTGWNLYEKALTKANCGGLRQLFTQETDGQIYAQPLYVPNLTLPGKGTHNVVYVVTENNSVYAFDADSAAGANASPLLSRSLMSGNEAAVPFVEVACDNIAPTIGITGTPVIDLPNQVLYCVVKYSTRMLTAAGPVATYAQRIHALDLTTLADRAESKVEITASVTNSAGTQVPFEAKEENQRAALLLNRGTLYIAWAAHCDGAPYGGWVLSYDAVTLNQSAVFCTAPDAVESGHLGAGIWQGGFGPACDTDGSIFVVTGNGDYNAVAGGVCYGSSVLKLSAQLKLVDFFMPFNICDLDLNDWDLGAGGPLLIPAQPGSTAVPLMTVCGKQGIVYALNRSNLGKFAGAGATGDTNIVNSLPLYPGVVPTGPGQPVGSDTHQPGVWGGPAYAVVGSKRLVFYCGAIGPNPPGGPVTAFAVTETGTRLGHDTVAGGLIPNQSQVTFPGQWAGGATPVISSSGDAAESAILWIIRRANPMVLYAFDPADLTQKLVQINAGPWSTPRGTAMVEATVINGKVYVGSDGQLSVFGL